MERLEQRMEAVAGDVTGIKRDIGALTAAIMGTLDRPGGLVAVVNENAKAIGAHEARLKNMEDGYEKLSDWIEERSTIERFGKWVIGGGGLALGLFLDQLIRLATGG